MTVTNRSELSQGTLNNVSDLSFTLSGTGAANRTVITGSATLPALADNEFFEIRDAPITGNNGLYRVNDAGPTTSSVTCEKVIGANPVNDGPDSVNLYGTTGAGSEKSINIDTARREIAILEQGNVDATGADGDAVYSFLMQEWKDDSDHIGAPFPINAIDKDAGKYFIGQDSSGNNNGWTWLDVSGEAIRTRKMLRNTGWDEIDVSGNTLARYFCALSVDVVEDPANDTAFFQFGNDFVVDDTNDLTFAGPANEAIEFFTRLADDAVNGGTGVAISADGRTLTRSDGGNWRTDGFVQGGQVVIRDAEDSTMDGTWLLKVVGSGVDGVLTCGRAADSSSGLAITGTDTITRADGGSFIDDGWVVGSKIIITAAEDVGNDGTHVVTSVTDTTLVATGSTFTNNADDTTMVLGMFDDALTPDTAMNVAIDNSNSFRLGLYVRDGDTNGKTYSESNLPAIGKTQLGNFVFQFPLPNATDTKITNTDAFIDGANPPFNGMSVAFHSTPQSRGGLVGGPYDFGIIVTGNDCTNIEGFEWMQRQLRLLTDIDTVATVIGRAVGRWARFNGDVLEVGSGDGGLTFPVNPNGGGSGVFIDFLNAGSDNFTKFWDNTGTLRSKPESIAVTLDFNQIGLDDPLLEWDLFFDRTIRTPQATLTDFVLTSGTDVLTSAGSNLPTNSEIAVGKYVRISGLTGADEPMNGVYQILVINTAGQSWDVARYDGEAIVSVAATAVDLDQNCIDTPDKIIVDTNVNVSTASDISFTAPDLIDSSGSELGVFNVGDKIRVVGSTGGTNDGIYEVATAGAAQLELVEQTITTQATGPTVTITTIFSGVNPSTDIVRNFAFDDNVQGGRTVSTETFVIAKAVGQLTAQYVQSPVSNIESGTPETIPLFSQTERNVT